MNRNITADESLEALRNDRRELYEMFNPQLVRIEELTAPAGSMYLAKITLMAPCYIVTSENDTEPKRVESNWFYLDVLDAYPDTKPKVYFEPHRRNAGMNTFVSGSVGYLIHATWSFYRRNKETGSSRNSYYRMWRFLRSILSFLF